MISRKGGGQSEKEIEARKSQPKAIWFHALDSTYKRSPQFFSQAFPKNIQRFTYRAI
jgi:hypothetical protein